MTLPGRYCVYGWNVSRPPMTEREACYRKLMALYRPYVTKYPDTRFEDMLRARYKVPEARLMTVEQLQDLVAHLEAGLKAEQETTAE
jgi:hypothetical protein